MKDEKSNSEKSFRSAEDWVSVARKFGEDCVSIQHDTKLTIDQKLEKQKALGDKMAKEINLDANLPKEDKHQMIESIQSYMHEWQSMHDMSQQSESKEGPSKSKK